jgi:hypothetical protein
VALLFYPDRSFSVISTLSSTKEGNLPFTNNELEGLPNLIRVHSRQFAAESFISAHLRRSAAKVKGDDIHHRLQTRS